jgi:hypothetical protein
MTDDIRKYRTLLETAMTQHMDTPSEQMHGDLERDAASTAELLVDVLQQTHHEPNLDRMLHDSLKALHGENYSHHDWHKFGRAVLNHAHALMQQRKAD